MQDSSCLAHLAEEETEDSEIKEFAQADKAGMWLSRSFGSEASAPPVYRVNVVLTPCLQFLYLELCAVFVLFLENFS